MPAKAGSEGFVTELELLRGELATLLYRHTRDNTHYVFGDEITGPRTAPTTTGPDEPRPLPRSSSNRPAQQPVPPVLYPRYRQQSGSAPG